jgi:hypothetical protein
MKTDAEWQAILDTPTSLTTRAPEDRGKPVTASAGPERPTREPAIPVIAPVPLASLRALLDLAAQDWPTLDAPGARVAWAVDARGVSVAAVLSIHDWDGRLLGRRTYDGQWEVGGSVTWSPGRMQD